MSTMPSVGSGTYSPGPNMVCSPEQEKVGTGSIEEIIYPVYSDLRIRATVSKLSVRQKGHTPKASFPSRTGMPRAPSRLALATTHPEAACCSLAYLLL